MQFYAYAASYKHFGATDQYFGFAATLMLRIYISKKRSVILFSLFQSLIQAIADENWFSQFFKT